MKERYGKLIGIAFLFNVTDLHYENIIAHGEYPVIIDNETFSTKYSYRVW